MVEKVEPLLELGMQAVALEAEQVTAVVAVSSWLVEEGVLVAELVVVVELFLAEAGAQV